MTIELKDFCTFEFPTYKKNVLSNGKMNHDIFPFTLYSYNALNRRYVETFEKVWYEIIFVHRQDYLCEYKNNTFVSLLRLQDKMTTTGLLF